MQLDPRRIIPAVTTLAGGLLPSAQLARWSQHRTTSPWFQTVLTNNSPHRGAQTAFPLQAEKSIQSTRYQGPCGPTGRNALNFTTLLGGAPTPFPKGFKHGGGDVSGGLLGKNRLSLPPSPDRPFTALSGISAETIPARDPRSLGGAD